jgi:hypothetical protein
MTRNQRRLHLWAWLILGPVLAAGLTWAMAARRPLPIQTPPTVETGAQP